MSSIIKSTDDHNKTILKAQAQAAEELKRERRDQERRHRRIRAEEAAAAERLRRYGKRGLCDDDEGWDRWDGRTAERRKVSRNWESWDGYDDDHDVGNQKRKRRRSRSREKASSSMSMRSKVDEGERRSRRSTSSDREPSPPKRRHSPEHKRDDHQSRRQRDRDHTRTNSRRSESRPRSSSAHPSDIENHKSRKRRRARSPKYALDDMRDALSPKPSRHSPVESDTQAEAREADLKQRLKDSRKEDLQIKRKDGQGSHDISDSRHGLTPITIPHSPSPGPRLPEQVPSKMDRYFEESYDPRLDVEPLAVPQVPATGLISDADFEGWDAMLELIRLRREDKVEKKRLERLGLLPTKDKARKVVSSSTSAVAERWNVEGVSIMNIEYNKKGTVREWDLGKEGF